MLGDLRRRPSRITHSVAGLAVVPPYERPARQVDLDPKLSLGQGSPRGQRRTRITQADHDVELDQLPAQLGQKTELPTVI
ncbi:hypothetical protein [Actinoallomurus rhizosphaericola]|uniref:hypothetical protein n=1 Tax=Actinoallomurus rhizosphaericola TaxID=2952536 RepID=UPI002090D7B7|nr:hypothetical protein [Actinoallomurus rhizosphaericola]MCO5993009.1 hypothetical protein [Actinoallomurus rhizosphaericola]